MVKAPPFAVPELGSCASSGRAWRLRAARRSQGEARPLGSRPLPRVLKCAASKAAGSTAFDHPGILVTALADVNLRSSTGATPLHVAVQGNRAEAVGVLLSHGADRAIKCDGRTPLQLAVTLGHSGCEKSARKFEADQAARWIDG